MMETRPVVVRTAFRLNTQPRGRVPRTDSLSDGLPPLLSGAPRWAGAERNRDGPLRLGSAVLPTGVRHRVDIDEP